MLSRSKHRIALGAILMIAAALPGTAAADDVVHPAGGSSFTTGLDGWGPASPGGCIDFTYWKACTLAVAQAGGELRATFPPAITETTASAGVQSAAFTVGTSGSGVLSVRQRTPAAEPESWTTTVVLLDVDAGTRKTILPEPEDRTDADLGTLHERSVPVGSLVAGRTYKLEIGVSANAFSDARPTSMAFDDVSLRVVDPAAVAPPALAALDPTPGIDQATLRSWVNPRGTATTVRHEYGTTTAYGSQTVPADAGAGTTGYAAETPVSGLQPCTTYHYRAVATSANGTSTGADRTFWTACKPTVVDAGAGTSGQPLWLLHDPRAVSPFGVRIGGRVRTGGLPTSTYFDLGTSTAYGQRWPGRTVTGTRRNPGIGVGIDTRLPDLQFGTVYHLRMVASNALGTTVGPDVTFRTGRPRPTVVRPELLRIRATTIRVPRTGRRTRQLRVPLTCLKANGRTCTGAIAIRTVRKVNPSVRGVRTAKRRQVTFAVFRYRLAAGRSATVTSRLAPIRMKLLRRLGSTQVTVTAQVTPKSGAAQTVSRRAKLTTTRR